MYEMYHIIFREYGLILQRPEHVYHITTSTTTTEYASNVQNILDEFSHHFPFLCRREYFHCCYLSPSILVFLHLRCFLLFLQFFVVVVFSCSAFKCISFQSISWDQLVYMGIKVSWLPMRRVWNLKVTQKMCVCEVKSVNCRRAELKSQVAAKRQFQSRRVLQKVDSYATSTLTSPRVFIAILREIWWMGKKRDIYNTLCTPL